MTFQRTWANNYRFEDQILEANVDLFGGPGSTLAVLHSIRAIEPIREGVNSEREFMIDYLAERIVQKWKTKKIVVMHKGQVVYSTDEELRKGDSITAEVKAISRGSVTAFALSEFWEAIKILFRRG